MNIKILYSTGDKNLAQVFVARFRNSDRLMAEFVDVCDPKTSSDEKWVIIISTQFGCPIKCAMCDAGGNYNGDLTTEEMLAQIDYIISRHPPKRLAAVKKFKVQFARMGEPALNNAVIDALETLPKRYLAPGLIPCIATTAPACAGAWFNALLDVRQSAYGGQPFQLQFSINSTDKATRDRLMPISKMHFNEIATYAHKFAKHGPRKVGLNFSLAKGIPVDPNEIAKFFDPECCCIKITPLNPTTRSEEMGLKTAFPPESPDKATALCEKFEHLGFDVILSIGDERENLIGSNCGMAVQKMRSNII